MTIDFTKLEDWVTDTGKTGVAISPSEYSLAPELESYHPHGSDPSDFSEWRCSTTKLESGSKEIIKMTGLGNFAIEPIEKLMGSLEFELKRPQGNPPHLLAVGDSSLAQQELKFPQKSYRIVEWKIAATFQPTEDENTGVRTFYDFLSWVDVTDKDIDSNEKMLALPIIRTMWIWVR